MKIWKKYDQKYQAIKDKSKKTWKNNESKQKSKKSNFEW